ncbi:MAG TPA: hypothetical protein VJ976_08855, partial [Ornithinimicrobium sp.]|uniref:hypothetical protein n=1 Tax=Ornithinimicrobium sp. TaxID=1977084 RepID=UPI002B48D8D1
LLAPVWLWVTTMFDVIQREVARAKETNIQQAPLRRAVAEDMVARGVSYRAFLVEPRNGANLPDLRKPWGDRLYRGIERELRRSGGRDKQPAGRRSG